MKKLFSLVVLLVLFSELKSQSNVGIGVTQPKGRLHISGSSAYSNPGILLNSVDGNGAGFLKFERPGVRDFNWTLMSRVENDPSGLNNAFILYHGIDSVNSLTRMILNIRGNGRMGIGNVMPSNPLSFPATLEKKISLYPGLTGDVGFAVWGNELRQYIDNVNGRITFGFDNFTTGFTERMRINAGDGNVGIGVTDPAFTLDLAGSLRIRSRPGLATGLWLNDENNTVTAAFFGMRNDQTMGFYGAMAGWGLQMNTQTGYVGIGMDQPNAPLQFPNDARNRKIVLYEHANDDNQFYGFGLNGGVLRYQTATPADDHVFYSGLNSLSSTELMRVAGNGQVGIGGIDPLYRLDVNGRMRIRSGGNLASSAGLWLNNTANTVVPAFIGMQNDNTVGFYGTGAGWALGMNTDNGALIVNGNAGGSGQVLRSNGPSAAAGWTNTGNLITTLHTKGTTGITTTATATTIPGSAIVITVNTRSRIIYSTNISGIASYCFACSSGQVTLVPFIDNTPSISQWTLVTTNEVGSKGTTTISNVIWDVSPGTYALYTRAQTNSGFRPIDGVTALYTTIMAFAID